MMGYQAVLENMPQLPYSLEEAIGRLRVNVSFLGNDIRKIMIISTVPDEGKSFVAMQLWRQMAESGKSSVLLDADLRKSILIEKYGIRLEGPGKIWGTSYYLANNFPIEEAILHTDLKYGDILPNAKNVVNPSRLLEGSRFSQMLGYMAEKYRYVFVDAPPLDLISDGERIGNLCDGAILVVRAASTSKSAVKNSVRQLEMANCPLLGVVLNRVSGGRGGYYYKKYNGRYHGTYYGDSYYYKK